MLVLTIFPRRSIYSVDDATDSIRQFSTQWYFGRISSWDIFSRAKKAMDDTVKVRRNSADVSISPMLNEAFLNDSACWIFIFQVINETVRVSQNKFMETSNSWVGQPGLLQRGDRRYVIVETSGGDVCAVD